MFKITRKESQKKTELLVAGLEAEQARLGEELRAAEDRLRESLKQVGKLEAEQAKREQNFTAEKQAVQRELNRALADLAETKGNLDSAKQENLGLTETVRKLSTDVSRLTDKLLALETSSADSASKSAAAIESVTKKLGSITADKVRVEAALRAAEVELERSRAESSKLGNGNVELVKQIQGLESASRKDGQEKNRLTGLVEELNKEKNKLQTELDQRYKSLRQLQETLKARDSGQKQLEDSLKRSDSEIKRLQTILAQQVKEKQNSETILAKVKEKAEKTAQDLKQVLAEKASAWEKVGQRDQLLQSRQKNFDAQLRESQIKLEKLTKQLDANANESKSALQEAEKEIDLLLSQLHEAHEALIENYEGRKHFSALYAALQARWNRLTARHEHYVDYSQLSVESFDNLSTTPTVTWRLKDFWSKSTVLPDLTFQTVLEDGCAGIAIVSEKDGQGDLRIIPKQLASSPKGLATFLKLRSSEFKKMQAAVRVLELMEATRWKDLSAPQGFDLGFWRAAIQAVIVQFKTLPPVFRFDDVKLKRELVNPDYEHLWLDIYDVQLGGFSCPKLEVRLGAALIQQDGFSLHPKFEIPLIDGKDKPFDSWFAESRDDMGPKLELRFSLERAIFDTAVLLKLSEQDRALVLGLITSFPDLLVELSSKKASVHRPWKVWTDFAAAAAKVLRAFINNARPVSAVNAQQTKAVANIVTMPTSAATSSAAAVPASVVKHPGSAPVAGNETHKPVQLNSKVNRVIEIKSEAALGSARKSTGKSVRRMISERAVVMAEEEVRKPQKIKAASKASVAKVAKAPPPQLEDHPPNETSMFSAKINLAGETRQISRAELGEKVDTAPRERFATAVKKVEANTKVAKRGRTAKVVAESK